MKSVATLLRRHPANPIIHPSGIPGCAAVMNPAAALYQGRVVLLLSVIPLRGKPAIVPAFSDDGISFRVEREPLINLPEEGPFAGLDEWTIDPRVTPLDGTYYIVHPASGWTHGTIGMLGRTDDFRHYERLEVISLPDNRCPVLFPEKIDGMYVRLDRPASQAAGASLWISRSPDLIHWGRHRPLLKGDLWWNTAKIGPCGPPLPTAEGWLVIYHGVYATSAGTVYSLGAALLDRHDPGRVIGKTQSPILMPEADYERCGLVPNTVFSAGHVRWPGADELFVYYGAADTCVCLATGSVPELVDACLKGS
jgi:predicted GH43/DUF377 family glycosyl hydrolase